MKIFTKDLRPGDVLVYLYTYPVLRVVIRLVVHVERIRDNSAYYEMTCLMIDRDTVRVDHIEFLTGKSHAWCPDVYLRWDE